MLEANHRAPIPPPDDAPSAQGAGASPREAGEMLAGTPFLILSKLAAGGMGTVYEAQHQALGRRVVLKLLHANLASDAHLVERLKREARVLAQLASPHVVTVSDLGQTAKGETYIAMERLYGHSLGQELRQRGALPVLEAVHWTREILAGLSAAHRAGIVHRDVKPDNVFLCDATEQAPRRVKLLDFGIAKVLNEATAGMDLSRHAPTAEGTVIGSPRWLAPEQACGKPVDARTDVYAAGLVLYALVAGRSPFGHVRDAMDALAASLSERPAPPSRYAAQDLPPELESAIMMAIEKDPDHRFQSAAAFSTALESIACAPDDATQPLPQAFLRQKAVVAEPAPAPARDAAAETGLLPTLVQRRAAPTDPEGVSLGTFAALTLVTALGFLLVLTLIGHYLHLGGF